MGNRQHATSEVQTDSAEAKRIKRNLAARCCRLRKKSMMMSDLEHQLETEQRRNKFLSLKILELKKVISQTCVNIIQVIEHCDVE